MRKNKVFKQKIQAMTEGQNIQTKKVKKAQNTSNDLALLYATVDKSKKKTQSVKHDSNKANNMSTNSNTKCNDSSRIADQFCTENCANINKIPADIVYTMAQDIQNERYTVSSAAYDQLDSALFIQDQPYDCLQNNSSEALTRDAQEHSYSLASDKCTNIKRKTNDNLYALLQK